MPSTAEQVAVIVDNMRRIFQVVHEHSKQAERTTGLTGPQLWALRIIARESPLSVSGIARRMYLHPATVVGILDRLERQRLVVRIRSQKDRRVVRVELTARGQTAIKRAPEAAQGLLVSKLERTSARNRAAIALGLKRMVELLGARGIPPKPMPPPGATRTSGKRVKR